MRPSRNLILVLGDQVTPEITSLAAGDPGQDLVLMAELGDEARSVRHQKKKIAFLFSAMRHCAGEPRGLGCTVEYVSLDAADNGGSFTAQLGEAIARHRPDRVVVTEAGEWRVREMQASWAERFALPVDVLPDERFLCPTGWFAQWAAGRKALTSSTATGGSAPRGRANRVFYLVSDESSLVTGSDLMIAGRMTAQ